MNAALQDLRDIGPLQERFITLEFPSHRYRLSEKAGKRNQGYVLRLETACQVFGL